jgi:methylenetetrahydrofolate dehydrogenase (NADP+)/methenyltetrahydrofolate cyclohydrolase
MEIFKRKNIDLKGKEAVVIGRSDIVGKPMALLLLHSHATVTICHSRTIDLPSVARRADILVVAIGKAEFVTSEFVKKGAIVIDVGINRVKLKEPIVGKDGKVKDSKLVGDVKFEDVKEIAGAITPVPGGVGPLTIAMLLSNTVKAAKAQTV